ncbi:serine/threonine protein kinase, CMGC, dual-specificity [Mortierella sp. AD031]|nr:serine/threonine protein kinase, CMGC, dual-specificity [Mortierella sp. AD031]
MAIAELIRYVLQLTGTRSNKLKLLFALLALATYKYRSHAIGTRRRPDLKQPKGALPFFGHLFLMASIPTTELYDVMEKNYQELGPIWSISLPGIGRMIQGDAPEIIEHVLKTNFWAYEKGPHFVSSLSDVFGQGIICADGERWKFQRKQATHLFNVKAFREYTSDVFNIEAQKVLKYLGKAADAGTVVDFHGLMLAFTLDTFGSVSFSESFGCLDHIEGSVPFATAIGDLLGICSDRIVDPLWKLREALTSVGKKAQSDKKKMRDYIRRIIEKRKETKEEFSQSGKEDLLKLLMDATDEDGNPLGEDYMIDIIVTFTIAGRDTMAQSVAWMFFAMLRNEADPNLMKNLVKEVDEVLGDGLPTYETHKQQKYAEACFFESLRMFPPLPRNLKMCVQDDVLPDGTKIYAGELFSWSSYVMGRSEKVWGPDVKEFKPDRWLYGAEKRYTPGMFTSFHLGPRTCVGQGFAVLEALTIVGLVLQKFELSLVEKDNVPAFGPGTTLAMLNGLPMRVARRPHKVTYKYRSHAIETRRRPELKQPKASVPPTEFYEFLEKNYHELGPVWSISMPGIGRMIQGDTPEIVGHVMKSNFWAYAKTPLFTSAFNDVFGRGIINVEGDVWKFQRKQATQLFSVKDFREYTNDVFNIEAKKVIDYLGKAADAGSVIDFHALLHAFSLDTFGSFECLENIDGSVPFADSIGDLLTTSADRLMDPFWKIREELNGVGKKARSDRSLLREHIRKIIKKRRRDGFHRNKRDLLKMFMEAEDEDGNPLEEEYLIAGRDTTALGLSWMFYAMLRDETDPKLMKTLIQEVDDVLGNDLPSYDTHRKQKFAEACLYETLRMFPPLPRNFRACVKDDILPDGTKIYAGEIFNWSSYVMGRSEQLWGPDVKEFRPYRFLQDEKASSMEKFTSFHMGPRACIGQHFAVLETLTFVGLVLQKFELSLVEPAKVPQYDIGMTLTMLHGLPMRVTRRARREAVEA